MCHRVWKASRSDGQVWLELEWLATKISSDRLRTATVRSCVYSREPVQSWRQAQRNLCALGMTAVLRHLSDADPCLLAGWGNGVVGVYLVRPKYSCIATGNGWNLKRFWYRLYRPCICQSPTCRVPSKRATLRIHISREIRYSFIFKVIVHLQNYGFIRDSHFNRESGRAWYRRVDNRRGARYEKLLPEFGLDTSDRMPGHANGGGNLRSIACVTSDNHGGGLLLLTELRRVDNSVHGDLVALVNAQNKFTAFCPHTYIWCEVHRCKCN